MKRKNCLKTKKKIYISHIYYFVIFKSYGQKKSSKLHYLIRLHTNVAIYFLWNLVGENVIFEHFDMRHAKVPKNVFFYLDLLLSVIFYCFTR